MENNDMQKWLRVLMYTMIVSIVNSVLNYLPFIPAVVTTWVSRGITVVMVLCMFQLASASPRYRKAGILRVVEFVCGLLVSIPVVGTVLVFTASVLFIIAVYQEYHAHGEAVADKDAVLARKWNRLFGWGVIAVVLTAMGSSITTVLLTLSGWDVTRIAGIFNGLLSLPLLVIDVVYITYIKRMLDLLSDGK